MSASVSSRKTGRVGWLIYSHEERRNAMTLAMQEAVPGLVEELQSDPDVRVVVLRGAGTTAFISGADITEFERERTTPEARERYEAALARSLASLSALDKPLIAMIHGFCLGGGLGVALQADIRIAAEDAQFAIPAARLGVGYGYRGVKKLVDVVGPANASEILFAARRLSAAEALRIGLINRAVPKAELEERVDALATEIAANAPLSIAAAKAAIREATNDPERRDLTRCAELVEACFESSDYREGRTAFLEKRRPVFGGS